MFYGAILHIIIELAIINYRFSVQRLVKPRQNWASPCEIVTHSLHGQRRLALVPEVGLDGLAFRREFIAEDDGVGNDVVARREMPVVGFRAMPEHDGVGFGVMEFDDQNAVADGTVVLDVGHDAEGFHIVGQGIAGKQAGASPFLACRVGVGRFVQRREEVSAFGQRIFV